MSKNRFLYLSTINPVRRDTGKAVMVYGMAQFLSETCDSNDFLFACFDPDGPSISWPNVSFDTPSRLQKLLSSFWHSFVLEDRSIQESFFYSHSVKNKILELMDAFKPTVIVFDTIRLGQYIEFLPNNIFTILYLEDLFSLRYRRQLNSVNINSSRASNPLGNFSKHLPLVCRRLIDKSWWLQSFLLRFEMNLVEKSEIRLSNHANLSLLINSDEVNILQHKLSTGAVKVIRPRLNEIINHSRTWCGEPLFVFLGTLNLAHNIDGILEFLRIVFPNILSRIPNITIRIVGRHAPDELTAYTKKFPANVFVDGYVDDINAVLASACALIAPLRFGSGVKIKIIDALACGTPIISTSTAVDGIQFVNNIHGIVCSQFSDFPIAMREALIPDKNVEFSKNCANLFNQTYSREAVDLLYCDIFHKM